MTKENNRGPFLTTFAVLFVLLAISNCTKALQYANNPAIGGIVIFGVRFEGILTNAILGPLMGAVIGAYAYGLWKLRPWVAPFSIAYAFYVPVNLVLFWYRQTNPEVPPLLFMLGYLALSLSGSIGTALYLAYHREKLATV